MLLFLVSLPVVPIITDEPWRMLVLWGSLLLILLTELLNTGIEQVANRLTREFSPEIKFAKDCGSAAVLVAVMLAAATWGLSIFEWWSGS